MSPSENTKLTSEDILDALGRSLAIIKFKPDGTIVDANKNFLNALGYDLDEIVGKHHKIFVDKEEAKSDEYKRFWNNLKNGEHQTGKFVRYTREGELIYISASYAPVEDKTGKVVGVVKMAQDITDSYKMEKEGQLKSSMVEGAPINMMTCDKDGTITYLNPASIKTLRTIEDMLPCKVDEIVGKKFDIFHKDPSFQQDLVKNPEGKFPRNAKLDFKGVILDLTATALKDANGDFIGLQACWADITAQEKERIQKEEVSKGVRENANTVSSAATQMSASAEQMDKNVQSTLSQVTEASENGSQMREQMESVMTATEEMNSAIKEIANGAQEAAKIANAAVDTAQEADTTVQGLNESSQEISNVIKAISTVAQQTNLLALNATIEAARAGEAGKGFAVVASEVKELAKETRAATEDITKKIEKIQGDTSKAVQSIKSITDIINRLNEIANTTASAVEEQSVTTNDMAKTISEANAGASQIAEALQQVTEQVNQVATGVEQNRTAASSLSQSSELLNDLVKEES